MLGGVVGNGDAGCGSLGVVHQRVDAAEFGHDPVDGALHHSLVVGAGVYIGLNGQHANAVFAFKTFFCRLKLFDVAPGDGQIRAFFCKRGSNAEADGTCRAVLKRGETRAGDDNGFPRKVTHGRLPSKVAAHLGRRPSELLACKGSPHARL